MRPLVLAWLATFALPAWAASTTVTLSVPTMDCPVCPITLKKALSKVAGVEAVTVSLDRREAIVTFDDVKTTVEALTRATRDAGYPSGLTERKP
ncbi:mercury resistance system periplasmic binding protein MerP [Aromatoleum evansii]|uniref:Periplasmic mercury ion-binding protein n=1 Tax=Aromatoleum evansii TaxID=59406 RepID=A0ABZ1AVA5_AROEV|nr:mercury resistance system periplasmic binding protein MerP [Aromatoleum toluclasticum]WRL48921.1 mercury resistance system periplasmic binding protein MerP [Aromatoleum evansii]